jgi:hypothetical protein
MDLFHNFFSITLELCFQGSPEAGCRTVCDEPQLCSGFKEQDRVVIMLSLIPQTINRIIQRGFYYVNAYG